MARWLCRCCGGSGASFASRYEIPCGWCENGTVDTAMAVQQEKSIPEENRAFRGQPATDYVKRLQARVHAAAVALAVLALLAAPVTWWVLHGRQ